MPNDLLLHTPPSFPPLSEEEQAAIGLVTSTRSVLTDGLCSSETYVYGMTIHDADGDDVSGRPTMLLSVMPIPQSVVDFVLETDAPGHVSAGESTFLCSYGELRETELRDWFPEDISKWLGVTWTDDVGMSHVEVSLLRFLVLPEQEQARLLGNYTQAVGELSDAFGY